VEVPYFPVHDPIVQPGSLQFVLVTLIVTVEQPVWDDEPLLIVYAPLDVVPKSDVPVPEVAPALVPAIVNVVEPEGICNVLQSSFAVCTVVGTPAQAAKADITGKLQKTTAIRKTAIADAANCCLFVLSYNDSFMPPYYCHAADISND